MSRTFSIEGALGFLRSKRHHARNILAQFASRGAALAAFALALPLFISHQGAAAYGSLALLLSAYSFLALFDFGVSYSVGLRYGRALARHNPRAASVLGGALPLTLVFASATSLVILVAARPISFGLYGVPDYASAIRIFAVTCGVLIVSATPAAVVLVHYRVDWFNYSKLIIDLAKAAGLVIGAFSRSGIMAAMWTLLVGTSAKCTLDFVLAKHLLAPHTRLRFHMRWADVRTNLGLGLPMSAATLVNVGLTTGDRVAVSRMLGPEALAQYSLAADICGKAYFLVRAISGSLYPLVIRNSAARRDVSSLMKVALISVALVSLLVYLPLGLLARPIISSWLGPAMGRGAATVTSLWAVVATIYLAMTVVYNHLQAQGRPQALVAANSVACAVFLGGLVVLARRASVESIAILMGLAFLVQLCGLTIALCQRKRRVLLIARLG